MRAQQLSLRLQELISQCSQSPPVSPEHAVFVQELEALSGYLGPRVAPVRSLGHTLRDGWTRVARAFRAPTTRTLRANEARHQRMLLRSYERLCEQDLPPAVASALLRQYGVLKRRSYVLAAPRTLPAAPQA